MIRPQENSAALIVGRHSDVADRVPALTFEGREMTYAQLSEAVQRLAAQLAAVGVRPGDAVGLPLPNGHDMVVALYAVWYLGGVTVPMNHTQTAREMSAALEDIDARAVLTTPELKARVQEASSGRATYALSGGELPESCQAVDMVAGDPDATAVVIFTSGTTGRPKGAALSRRALDDANAAIGAALKGRPGPYPLVDRWRAPTLIPLPLSHTGGLFSLLFAHYAGRHAVVLDRFRIDPFLDAVTRYSVDTVVVTPAMIQMLTNAAQEVDLGAVRIVQSTGAPLAAAVKARFERRFGLPIIQNYGQTESLHVAGWTRQELTEGTWRPGSVGRPYAGVEVRIMSEEGADLPSPELGEIVVRSRHTMSAYVGEVADGDRSIDASGWLHTGDLGYLDDDGYLYVVDRKREVMIVGGFNVYPAEVEGILLEHPSVAEVVVVGLPDERLGEVPHAVVVRADDSQVSESELIRFSRHGLAGYKAPRGITWVDSLPQTPTQKVKRQQVRELLTSTDTLERRNT
jgi:long-chain acyl-CoA synthetase